MKCTDYSDSEIMRYCALSFSSSDVIEAVGYFGADNSQFRNPILKVDEWNLMCLVGLNEGFCNNLVGRYDEGLIKDFVQ